MSPVPVPPGGTPIPFPRAYVARQDLVDGPLSAAFDARGFDDFLVRDFAWDAVKDLYALSRGLDESVSLDAALEKELWGVQAP